MWQISPGPGIEPATTTQGLQTWVALSPMPPQQGESFRKYFKLDCKDFNIKINSFFHTILPLLNPGMPLSSSGANSYQQGCIRVTLEDSELWKSFHTIGTEMIITKHGRRMFPQCSISLSGLQPLANYVVMVDIVPADNVKYKWKKEQWEVAGKSEPQPPCRTYIHPDSPAVGSHWMKQSLSFLKMKLTNNTLDQHGHVKTLFHTLNLKI
uniref:T-box domain-containing protein n=1 Tax=Xiphophorus maculatus TaxID=8083 RepID=A0A3B5QMT0_XIPMA